jgi:hypothetical protein
VTPESAQGSVTIVALLALAAICHAGWMLARAGVVA